MGVVRAHVTGCAGLLTPRRLPVPAPICKDTSWLTDTLSSYLGADVKLRTPSGERSMIGFGPTFPLAPGLCPDRCVVLGTENWKNQHPAPTPGLPSGSRGLWHQLFTGGGHTCVRGDLCSPDLLGAGTSTASDGLMAPAVLRRSQQQVATVVTLKAGKTRRSQAHITIPRRSSLCWDKVRIYKECTEDSRNNKAGNAGHV